MAPEKAPVEMMLRWFFGLFLLLISLLFVACTEPAQGAGDAATATDAPEVETLYPDVIDVAATRLPDGTFRFAVTLSSPYDSPERYADAWRVLTLDGKELGVRILTHDHASEQPFTRSLEGVQIPDDVRRVRVQGRDQVSGWGGKTAEVDLPE